MTAASPEEYDIPAILSLPVQENTYEAATIGQYLGASIGNFLTTGRICNLFYGDWKRPLLTALVKGNILNGVLQSDGSLYSVNEREAVSLLEAVKDHLTSADYSKLLKPEPPREWYVVDTEEDENSKKMIIIDILSGPHTEEEARKLKDENWNGPSYETTAFVAHIPTPEFLKPVA